jgi:hypothetical protein
VVTWIAIDVVDVRVGGTTNGALMIELPKDAIARVSRGRCPLLYHVYTSFAFQLVALPLSRVRRRPASLNANDTRIEPTR